MNLISGIPFEFTRIPFLAYIDPAFGSLVFQVIAGTVLGGLLVIKLWWERISRTVSGPFRRKHEND